MKKFLLGTAALLALASQASAADLAARPYTKAPPMMAAGYDWSGFYLGASGGYGWGRTREQFTGALVNTNHGTDGGLAGGQIGYNWQTSAWVFGVEADGHWADISGSTACPNPAFLCTSNTRTLASFRGRLGFASGAWLFYGTGGLGYANTRYTALSAGVPSAGSTGVFTADRWGYAAGAGIEWGFTPNWSAKIEYMHYGFDNVVAPVGTLSGLVTTTVRPDIDTVKVGINYRWGGPVVARY